MFLTAVHLCIACCLVIVCHKSLCLNSKYRSWRVLVDNSHENHRSRSFMKKFSVALQKVQVLHLLWKCLSHNFKRVISIWCTLVHTEVLTLTEKICESGRLITSYKVERPAVSQAHAALRITVNRF